MMRRLPFGNPVMRQSGKTIIRQQVAGNPAVKYYPAISIRQVSSCCRIIDFPHLAGLPDSSDKHFCLSIEKPEKPDRQVKPTLYCFEKFAGKQIIFNL